MTTNNWLQESTKTLKNRGVESAHLDALLLLEHVTKLDRAHILAHTDRLLTQSELGILNDLLSRREKREPVAYLTNHIEFYGRDFFVDKNVLLPRPESENFIALLNELPGQNLSVLDLGCGSGILGISAKLENPTFSITLSDIDNNALNIARKNATTLGAEVNFLQQDLLGTTPIEYDVIMTNLPYVPTTLNVQTELSFEPPHALFSGEDGLDHYRRFWSQVSSSPVHFILTESLETQHEHMTEYAKEAGYTLSKTQLLIQIFTKI